MSSSRSGRSAKCSKQPSYSDDCVTVLVSVTAAVVNGVRNILDSGIIQTTKLNDAV